MEFNEKLHRLRKERGITQEELASALYVSRTAVSKWESGRGYPSIESLRAIAKYFSVSLDDLLSADEAVSIAEEDGKGKKARICDMIFATLDTLHALFIFMPIFAERTEGVVRSVSLLSTDAPPLYLRVLYFSVIAAAVIFGILSFAFQNIDARIWERSKAPISLALSSLLLILFIAALHPYAACLSLLYLIIKSASLYLLKK
jgi:transcriptional regulator with XRE-family HTH domain